MGKKAGAAFAIGHTFGVRVHRVQKVHRVQRGVVAADAADYKRGARLTAGCVEGL